MVRGAGNGVSERRQKNYHRRTEAFVIVLGVILLLLGFLFHVSILWTIGIILLVIGAVLWIAGSVGRPVAGRRHYW
jgi:uncharacterized membrane protein HdeD (DUF308 family)